MNNDIKNIKSVLFKACEDNDIELLYYAKFKYFEMRRAQRILLPHEYTKLYNSKLTIEEIKELLEIVELYILEVNSKLNRGVEIGQV